MKKKIVRIFIIIMILITVISPNAFAEYGGIDTDISISDSEATRSSVEITERILGTLQVAGTVISIIALIVIGMKYMFSSIEAKTKMKGVIGYYIIGCILVFATSNVLGFAYDIITEFNIPGNNRTPVIVPAEQENGRKCNHEYGEVKIIFAATCTGGEVKEYKCIKCEKKQVVSGDLDSNNHERILENEMAATCTEEGKKGMQCIACGVWTEFEITEAAGHRWNLLWRPGANMSGRSRINYS